MYIRLCLALVALAALVGTSAPSLATPEKVPLYPLGVRTGRARVDAVLQAVQKRNVDRLLSKVKFRLIPCVKDFQPGVHPHPPFCRPGEEDGTVVAVIRGSAGLQCNTTWLREDDVRAQLLAFSTETSGVYAVVRENTDRNGAKGLFRLIYGFRWRGGFIGGALFLDGQGQVPYLYLRTCRSSPRQVLTASPGVLVLGPRERP